MFDYKTVGYDLEDDKTIVRLFISEAQRLGYPNDMISEKLRFVEKKIEKLNLEIEEAREMDFVDSDSTEYDDFKDQEENIHKRDNENCRKTLEKELDIWNSLKKKLEDLIESRKYFKKRICLSNIRELLRKNPKVKIGQIEKMAEVRLGYMSRLEKEGNTAEPSMEFIVTAAKLLQVSIDALVLVDFTELTPTEAYLVNFLDKLKNDTLEGKITWERENYNNFDNYEEYEAATKDHPLFEEIRYFEDIGNEYPLEMRQNIFNSKTFGENTKISGYCYSLELKKGRMLYLMDIDDIHGNNSENHSVKEAWMFIPGIGRRFLCSSQENTQVALILEQLFYTVKERTSYTEISEDVLAVIDSFMEDNSEDNLEDNYMELPF